MAYEFAKSINKNVKTIEFDALTDKNKDDFINEKVKTYNEIDYPVRIGNRKIIINKNTKAYEIYNKLVIEERHKHRFCIKPELFKKYENDDAKISATNENKNICEIFEITSHPFYIGVQYHPEYNVKPIQPEKLFTNFLIACKNGK
jgi:CTP synthase